MRTLYGTHVSMSSERVHRLPEQTLRMFVSHVQDDWVDLLRALKFECYRAGHDSTGQTLFILNYGRHLPVPVNRAIGENVPATNNFVRVMSKAIQDATCNLVRAQQR